MWGKDCRKDARRTFERLLWDKSINLKNAAWRTETNWSHYRSTSSLPPRLCEGSSEICYIYYLLLKLGKSNLIQNDLENTIEVQLSTRYVSNLVDLHDYATFITFHDIIINAKCHIFRFHVTFCRRKIFNLFQKWQDPSYKWDPEQFGGKKYMLKPAYRIWKPVPSVLLKWGPSFVSNSTSRCAKFEGPIK